MSSYKPTTKEHIDGQMGPNVANGIQEYADWIAKHERQTANTERERILAILERRAADLEACGKRDDCKEMAMIVRVCMSDIQEVSK